jgi:hypothetical protein
LEVTNQATHPLSDVLTPAEDIKIYDLKEDILIDFLCSKRPATRLIFSDH